MYLINNYIDFYSTSKSMGPEFLIPNSFLNINGQSRLKNNNLKMSP